MGVGGTRGGVTVMDYRSSRELPCHDKGTPLTTYSVQKMWYCGVP